MGSTDVDPNFVTLFSYYRNAEIRGAMLRRYLAHVASPSVDPETCAALHTVTKDEKWHITWMENKLREIAGPEGEDRVAALLARDREAEHRVFAALEPKEREAFGFSVSEASAA